MNDSPPVLNQNYEIHTKLCIGTHICRHSFIWQASIWSWLHGRQSLALCEVQKVKRSHFWKDMNMCAICEMVILKSLLITKGHFLNIGCDMVHLRSKPNVVLLPGSTWFLDTYGMCNSVPETKTVIIWEKCSWEWFPSLEKAPKTVILFEVLPLDFVCILLDPVTLFSMFSHPKEIIREICKDFISKVIHPRIIYYSEKFKTIINIQQ